MTVGKPGGGRVTWSLIRFGPMREVHTMAITDDRRLRVASDVPFAMRDPLHVPRERYFDREFFELEKEYLWPRVWQMACRLEEIPSAGDFIEYEICDQSIILVRLE